MRSPNRRDFLRDSALLTGALAAGNLRAEEAAPRARGRGEDVIRVTVVGVRGQGKGHVSGYAGRHGCVVTTICDVDEAVVGPAIAAAEKGQRKAPRHVKDV